MQSKILVVLSTVAIVGASFAMAYGASGAPMAPLTGIQTSRLIQVYSDHYRHSHQYIVVPQYYYWRRDFLPYMGPQGFYQSPFGPERWGYWCEGAGARRLSC
jgi:hypothetical protein